MTHGGARTGAGRKAIRPEDRKVQLGVRVTPEAKEWLMRKAEAQGVPAGRIIEDLIRRFA